MEGVFFYETLNGKGDVEIRKVVIYQGPEEQTEYPTNDEVWKIIRTV
jgi:NADH:ubiquinone oxidoreductase subunit